MLKDGQVGLRPEDCSTIFCHNTLLPPPQQLCDDYSSGKVCFTAFPVGSVLWNGRSDSNREQNLNCKLWEENHLTYRNISFFLLKTEIQTKTKSLQKTWQMGESEDRWLVIIISVPA